MKRINNKNWFFSVLILCTFIVFGEACNKNESVPELSTSNVSGITSTTAICGGNITSDGGAAISERGVCWSTSPNPSVNDSKATDGSTGLGSYTSNLSGLTGDLTYFVRAYAINKAGVGYGEVKSFSTSAISNFATTLDATEIKSSIATLNGVVNANSLPTTISFQYGTSLSYGNEISATPSVVTGNMDELVSANLTGLLANTTYHFRLKIVNSSGTAFGNDMTFYTKYVVGEHALGGIVFNVDLAGQHGLVCAESYQASNIPWYNGTYVITGANQTEIGTGKNNTELIVSIQGSGNYAAKICDDLVLNGYNDWFLPSKDELLLIANTIGIDDGIYNEAHYWSSSEYDLNNAWNLYITNLLYYFTNFENKSNTVGYASGPIGSTTPFFVKAVREF